MTLRLLALTGLPLLAAVLLPFAGRLGARGLAWASAAIAVSTLAVALPLAAPVLDGEVLTASVPWAPAMGLSFSFLFDGLSLLFVFIIVGVGLLVIVYARYYLSGDEPLPRFYASLLLFMAAMLGVVTSSNLLLLVVFWELTSLASFLLIGFWDEQPASRAGAYQSLIVTGVGGLALLAGVILLAVETETFELHTLLQRADEVRALSVAPIALGLILFGAFTKSAQVPFHFWLPSAMAAPTPVSAYLHSATMVKAGIFLLARLWPIFAATDLWYYAVTGVGAATMLVGGWAALRQTDLKALLAYSTVSQLGLITMLYGYGTHVAAIAATFHILNHAAFKAPLFMAAGIIDHEAGSRDLGRLGGLARYLPRTALLAAVATAAMAGVPLLNGFLSKELFYEASLAEHSRGTWAVILPLVALAGSTLTVAYSLRFVIGAFFGPTFDFARRPHEPPRGMRAPVALLVLLCVAVGLAPDRLAGPLLTAAASAVAGVQLHVHLALWHGWTVGLALSALAFAGGIAYYVVRRDTARTLLPPRLGRTAGELYDLLVQGLLVGSQRLTDRIQAGSLRSYIYVVLCFVMVLAATGTRGSGEPLFEASTEPLAGARMVTVLMGIGAVAVAAFYRHRLPSVIALAFVGLLVAIYFTWLSAPDLVVTQLLVEAVTTILVVLVLYFLPKEIPGREPRRRIAFDTALALAVGIGVGTVVYGVLRRPFDSISSYHLAESIPRAGGGNVVNVILVDFRGYDTLGEITVLAIAATGIIALIHAGRRTA